MGITSFLSGMEWKQGSDFSIAYFDTKEQLSYKSANRQNRCIVLH